MTPPEEEKGLVSHDTATKMNRAARRRLGSVYSVKIEGINRPITKEHETNKITAK